MLVYQRVPTTFFRPMFLAYVREYPHRIWPEIWVRLRTSNLGSWRSPIECFVPQSEKVRIAGFDPSDPS